jgi:predicted Fe-Mo cluster-binding NifX family protein
MKIAVASQNRKTVTDHAGKCRRFWIYQLDGSRLADKYLLELPMQQTLHASPQDAPHPLDTINVLICGGLGAGLQQRLKQRGIQAIATPETDPDRAVAAWLVGTLEELPAELHEHAHLHAGGWHVHAVETPARHSPGAERVYAHPFKERP